MKQIKMLGAAFLALALVACGDDDDDGGTPPPSGGFTQPAGTVPVNFVVNDTANKVWQAGQMEWKGQVDWNPTTRVAVKNDAWLNPTGEWPLLYDDGPWNQGTPPGHEPAGATANDHIWGVTVFVAPPAAGSPALAFEYGLRDATNPDPANGGWIWQGSNGTFAVPAGATAAITAPGLTFQARGTKDMRLELDTNALLAIPDPGWNTATVEVKGSAWGWSEVTAVDDGTGGDLTSGDGVYTFVLSGNINQNAPPYPGLLKTGDQPEFVWVLNGVEYKDPADGSAAEEGAAAAVREGTTSTTWTTVPVTLTTSGFINTRITVP